MRTPESDDANGAGVLDEGWPGVAARAGAAVMRRPESEEANGGELCAGLGGRAGAAVTSGPVARAGVVGDVIAGFDGRDGAAVTSGPVARAGVVGDVIAGVDGRDGAAVTSGAFAGVVGERCTEFDAGGVRTPLGLDTGIPAGGVFTPLGPDTGIPAGGVFNPLGLDENSGRRCSAVGGSGSSTLPVPCSDVGGSESRSATTACGSVVGSSSRLGGRSDSRNVESTPATSGEKLNHTPARPCASVSRFTTSTFSVSFTGPMTSSSSAGAPTSGRSSLTTKTRRVPSASPDACRNSSMVKKRRENDGTAGALARDAPAAVALAHRL